MITGFDINLLFAHHLLLFVVKLWVFSYIFRQLINTKAPNTENYLLIYKPAQGFMAIFSFIMVIAEIYYLYNFYEVDSLLYYEHLSMFDEEYWMILSTLYIKKEVKNGKK